MKSERDWRYLRFREVVRKGDEFDSAADGYNDDPIWRPVNREVGIIAPDPKYPAHRRFRRFANNSPMATHWTFRLWTNSGMSSDMSCFKFDNEEEALNYAEACVDQNPAWDGFEVFAECQIELVKR
jgi:hypothetical protein